MSAITRRKSDPDTMRVVVSPYRICPIGAHSDHQGGPTLGMAVSAHTVLTFTAATSSAVTLTSENFPGDVSFDLATLADAHEDDGWGVYARAAALALTDRLPRPPIGIQGTVRGSLPGGGLSSSASVVLSYLTALAGVNAVELSPNELVDLALRAEREFVGVKVGLLDPAAIVGARRDHLLAIDSRAKTWKPVPLGEGAPPFQILIAASGVTRNLAATSYNRRVDECFDACRKLAEAADVEGVDGLHDLDDAVFDEFEPLLSAAEARRARHFFTERARVQEGVVRWRDGDLEGFGELMNLSCESSITNWEAGSAELIDLQRALQRAPGVYGSRFSGAGFGGCVVALVEDVDRIAAEIDAEVFRVESDDGVRSL